MFDSFELFVFDLDGTLADSREDLTASVNAMRARFGLKRLPVEQVAGYVGEGMRLLIERSLADSPGTPIEEAMRIFSAHYSEHCLDRTRPYPGVMETLARLSERAKLAVASNKPEAMTVRMLEAFGIAPMLSAIIGGDTLRNRKPDPEPVLEIMRRAGKTASVTLVVGDGWTDIAAGKAAGAKTCYVPGIGDPVKAAAAGPDFRISDIRELAAPA